MHFCYLDESGCTGALPSATAPIQPVFVVGGFVINGASVPRLTRDFLALKWRYFANRMPASGRFLDALRVEIKGAELRRHAASPRRRERRQAVGFLDRLLELLQRHRARLIARVWIKDIGARFDGSSVYAYSVQDLCACFDDLLTRVGGSGLVIADSRNKPKNSAVSHAVFTRKFKSTGDAYPRVAELPTFGHSENHAGLQVADLL